VVGKVLGLFAQKVLKEVPRTAKRKGYVFKKPKFEDTGYYEYGPGLKVGEGKLYKLEDLLKRQRRGEKGKPISGYVPKEVEKARLAGVEAKPTVVTAPKMRSHAEEKANRIMNTLESMDDMDLVRLTDNEMVDLFGSNVTGMRQNVLRGRGIDPNSVSLGRRHKAYDEFGNPIPTGKFSRHINDLSKEISSIIKKLFKDIDEFTDEKVYSQPLLGEQIGRMIYQGKIVDGIPEDAVVEHILRQMSGSGWGRFLSRRAKRNPRIKRAIEKGAIKKSDRPQLSHVIPVSKDWTKGATLENVFYGPAGENLAAKASVQSKPINDYLRYLDEIMGVDGYAGGGIIKKLLKESVGNISRRKFLKGMGATAVSAALPKSAMKLAAPAAKKAAISYAPPWVNGMLSALKGVTKVQAGTKMLPSIVGNNANIIKTGSKKIKVYKDQTATESYFRVKTADYKMADDVAEARGEAYPYSWDDVVLREEPGQTTISWKNKMYDHGNDQHIVIDKINKETRFVDDNWHMEAGGEDIAKDDWIEWGITTNKEDIAKALKKPVSEIDDAIIDGNSINDMENDYAGMFQSYVDSFSPSGNVFGSVERMKLKMKKADKLKQQKIEDALERQKRWDEQDRLRENKMMDWEEQFRGGHGMHGYRDGGSTIRPRFKPPRDDIRPRAKPGTYWPTPDNMDMNRLLNAMAHVESRGDPFAIGPPIKGRTEKAHGMYQILPSTARDPGYNVTPWDNFSNEWKSPSKQREFAQNYIQGLVNHYDGDWQRAISQYGGDKTSNYWNKIMHAYGGYNKGGTVEKPYTVEDAIKEIRASPQKFMGGGLVKKLFAPKVVGKLTDYKPKITGRGPDLSGVRADMYTPPKGPYTLTDESGVRTIDMEYKTLSEAQAALKALSELRTQDASTFKIFGKRPPKTAEGVSEPAPEVNLGMVGKEIPPEKPGAMFWGSREKIIGAPSEAMTGKQWLQYLQLGKHGILNPKGYPIIKHMELNDTGLAPHLSKMGNKTVTKEQLVKDFDGKLAPEIDVVALGGSSEDAGKIYNKVMKYDMQAYRPGPVKNVLQSIRNAGMPLKEAIENNNQEAVSKIIDAIEGSVFNNTGVANSIREGFPQKFPFELKKILQDISSVTKTRLAGFDEYAKKAQYKGTQTLGGGENYREFVFKYKHPKGSLRETEPYMTYAQVASKQGAPEHFTGLADKDTMGGFMHVRMSDRTDEFGRRILHIEEIQADMHQAMNRKQRAIKKKLSEGQKVSKKELAESKYAPRGDLITEPIDKANEEQMGLILAKIDEIQAGPMNKKKQIRLNRLNKERIKIRKIIEDKKAKMAEGDHSGVPMGPFSKTEDYNEFVMKYATKVAQEGGYDGVTISSAAIKNRGVSFGGRDYKGNLIAYGPMAEGAMKKAAKKSGAKFIKTAIIDDKGRGWEVPMIWFDTPNVKFNVQKGLPIYKKGGVVING